MAINKLSERLAIINHLSNILTVLKKGKYFHKNANAGAEIKVIPEAINMLIINAANSHEENLNRCHFTEMQLARNSNAPPMLNPDNSKPIGNE